MSDGVHADQGAHNSQIMGQKSVTSAGTRVQLSSSVAGIFYIVIKAKAANTGKIYVGDSTVSSSNGFELSASESLSYTINEISKIYIDASVSGEGVSYIAVSR